MHQSSHPRIVKSDQPLRPWPGVVLVLLQWLAAFGVGIIAPGTMLSYFAMIGGPTLGLLLLALWWLFFSRAPWTDRMVGVGLVTGCLVAAFNLVDPSATFALFIPGVPVLCLACVLWLLLSRRLGLRMRRVGAVAVILVAVFGWTVVRTEGVYGSMASDFAWRWSSTTEERLLASQNTDEISSPSTSGSPSQLEEAAWTGFRGERRDGHVRDLVIDTSWDSAPPEEIWRRPIGPGWSSFAVVGDRLFTQEQRGENEIVSCYDAFSGEPLWLHQDRTRFWEAMAGAGPRATPTYHDGRIYALGATGILNCLDAETGQPIWSRELPADTGAAVPDWGFSGSPLVALNQVIVHAGGADGQHVVAYDAASGEPRWFAATGAASYSSPHLATIDGVVQVLMLTGDGLTSLDPHTGDVLWQHLWPVPARFVQPMVTDDGRVMIGSPLGFGMRSIQVSLHQGSWQVAERWTSRALKPYYNDFVAHRGHLFGFDDRIFACVDAESGARKWKNGRYGFGQVLLIVDQDLALVVSETGDLVLVNADPERFQEVARVPAIKGKTWNHPVIVDDRLYVRNAEEAACFRLTRADPSASAGVRPGFPG